MKKGRIKVGDYVKNPGGFVGKVIRIRRYKDLADKAYYEVRIAISEDGYSYCNCPLKDATKVPPPSPN